MKKIIFAGGLIALSAITVTPAFAQSTKTATTTVTATVPQSCSFTTTPPSGQTITSTVGDDKNIGDLGYTCNFVGSVHLTLSLPNGTNLYNPSSGGDTVAYGLAWTLPPNSPTPSYQSFGAGDLPFDWPTAGSANTENKGTLFMKLNAPLTVAGTYTSVITYTIAP